MTFAEYKAKRRPPGRRLGVILLLVLLGLADAGALYWSAPGLARKGGAGASEGDVRGNFAPGVAHFVMLNVGQGEASFLRTPNGKNIVFDAGSGGERYPVYAGYSHFNAGEHVTAAFLRKNGVRYVDTVVLSHPDGDHVGGMMNVWEYLYNEGTGAGAYIEPGTRSSSNAYKDHLAFIDARKIPYTSILDPTTWERRVEMPWDFVGDPAVKMEIISPLSGIHPEEHPNENSITIRSQVGPFTFLMAGDAENQQEEEMVRHYGPNLACHVMWAPHHGSKTSILPAFLRLANPRVLANSSFPPFYAHPNILAVRNWSRHVTPKPRLFRTNLQGHIWFQATPERITMRSLYPERSEPEQWEPGQMARTAPEGPAAVFRRYGKLEPQPAVTWEDLDPAHEITWTFDEISQSGGVAPGGQPGVTPHFVEPPKKERAPRGDSEARPDREEGESK